MGYRKLDRHPHHHGHRYTQNLTTPSDVWMENGSTLDLALPCFYKLPHTKQPIVEHCRDWHDFVGQPAPDHPDHVWQPPHHHHHHGHPWVNGPHCVTNIKHIRTIPIHLKEEGYDKFTIDIDPSGVAGTCELDEADDHIIRVSLHADVDDLRHHIDKERVFCYTIRAYITEENRIDVVTVGHIHVLPDVLSRK